jgi:hypothetical protein
VLVTLSTQPEVELTDPMSTLALTTEWIHAATPLWVAVRGPRGTLELRSDAARSERSLHLKGDGYSAIALALLTSGSGPSSAQRAAEPASAGAEWSQDWDAFAEARLSLR